MIVIIVEVGLEYGYKKYFSSYKFVNLIISHSRANKR